MSSVMTPMTRHQRPAGPTYSSNHTYEGETAGREQEFARTSPNFWPAASLVSGMSDWGVSAHAANHCAAAARLPGLSKGLDMYLCLLRQVVGSRARLVLCLASLLLRVLLRVLCLVSGGVVGLACTRQPTRRISVK